MNAPQKVAERPDLLLRILEWGLIAVVVLAPLPLGAVVGPARLALELGAMGLGAVWVVRTLRRGGASPPLVMLVGLAGLLLLGVLQLLPLGEGAIRRISPHSVAVRQASLPQGEAARIEQALLGRDPTELAPRPALSLAPEATASALRTGAAWVVLLVVATGVAAERGLRGLTLALLWSCAFQALYGILVLASGHDMIWHVPKQHYLGSATGTFVNRNHFAGLLAAGLPCALALILDRRRSGPRAGRWRDLLLRRFSPEGARLLLLGGLWGLGLSGLLLSFSRAGIAVALLAISITLLAHRRPTGHSRWIPAALVLALAIVPLAQVGADRLARRYSSAVEDLTSSGDRLRVWSDTLSLAGQFPVVGSGFGSFASVYPLYRSPEVRKFWEHAHNDPLQLVAEGGVIGAGCLLMVVIPLGRRMFAALRNGSYAGGVGLAAGLVALMLHALVDFNFHIPANAALASVLAGALMGAAWNDPS